MKLYRYDNWYNENGTHVSLSTFMVEKETPKGYWIIEGKRWVSKESTKRFAYPTTEQAWVSYKARKKRQIRILQDRLQRAIAANSLTQPKDVCLTCT